MFSSVTVPLVLPTLATVVSLSENVARFGKTITDDEENRFDTVHFVPSDSVMPNTTVLCVPATPSSVAGNCMLSKLVTLSFFELTAMLSVFDTIE